MQDKDRLFNAELEKQVCLSNIAAHEARIVKLEDTKAHIRRYRDSYQGVTEEEIKEIDKSIDNDKATIEVIKKRVMELDEILM